MFFWVLRVFLVIVVSLKIKVGLWNLMDSNSLVRYIGDRLLFIIGICDGGSLSLEFIGLELSFR